MIVSYHRNFIYIRTRKTASSTIEGVLKQHLGPDDLFVGKGQIRKPRSGGRRANKTRLEAANGEVPDDVAGHMNAAQIKSLVPESFWNSCFKFTSERHPYEKAVSLAYYKFGKGQERKGDFTEFLDRIIKRGHYRSFDQYTIDGEVVVSDFVRHETLLADLNRIGRMIGFSVPDELPQKRTVFRTDRRPAREILSEQQKRHVFERCREEFDLLGYEP